MHSRFRVAAIVAALIPALALTAAAGQQHYAVFGEDTYKIGRVLGKTHIVYSGTERLDVTSDASGERYEASVAYTRSDDSGRAAVRGHFVQEMLRDGSFEDRSDDDPDFLTILNQPFAVQLDRRTFADIEHLHGTVPFVAASPLGGSHLSGHLSAAPEGLVHGRVVYGVRFVADGPMTGTLPDHPDALLAGTMHMNGTAYYAQDRELLLALDATLTIDGKLESGKDSIPVKIVYRRYIRAD
jgi:hypothetical protein